MIKISEVIKHIEKLYKIELTEIQVDFLKHVIKGDAIYTPRCFGRSMIYNGYADYLTNVVGKSVDYSLSPADFDTEWIKKHNLKKHGSETVYCGAIGGGMTYIFTPTSIGTVGKIRCSCGEEFCFRNL